MSLRCLGRHRFWIPPQAAKTPKLDENLSQPRRAEKYDGGVERHMERCTMDQRSPVRLQVVPADDARLAATMASGGLPVSRRRPSSADETPPPEDDSQRDDGKLPALPSRPLSSSGSRARNARQDGREERRSGSQELTLVPIERSSAGNSPSPETTDVSSTSPDSKGRVSEANPRNRDLVLLDLKEHVERLEQDLKLTSELLRQANRELSRKDAAITRLNRHNDRLRGKVVRLESDVAVYKASAATSSDEDSEGGDGGHVCCTQDRELLKALTGIYSKMQKTDGVRKDSDRLPDAKLVEQVFAKFWQDYLEVSRELESCKQMVAYQELKIQDLEAARLRLEPNHRGCQSDAERTVKAQKLAHLHRGREVNQTFLLIDDLQQESQAFRDGSEKKDRDAAPASKDAGEERRLRQCVNRLQLDNNRLVVLNKEISAREAATKRELQRVQTKLSSFKSDLAKATKRVLGRESSCVFPTEVSLGILLDELVALRRQNVQLKAFQQREIHHQRPESTGRDKELTLVPIERSSAGNSPSPETTDVSSTSPDSKGRVSEANPRDRDLVLLDLKEHVERLEQDLKLTSELLRQANRELSRKDAAITRLNRHNDRLRGKVVRLESDVAVYKASAATSSDEDSEGGDGGHVCCIQDRELLKAFTGIYSKMQKTDGVRKDSDRLPDAKLVEQVFAKFWQDYLEVSRELESCKQMVAYQELKIQDLEAARLRLEPNHRGCQSEAERTVKAQKLAHLHRGREVNQTFLLIDDLQQESQVFRDGSEKKDRDAAPASKDAGEERRLRQCVNRLQLDNNRLVVLNKEMSAREAATKRELQRVQTKLSSFKSDLAKATKRVLGRESSCVFPTEVSLGILLDELVALRRQNVQLKAFQQREIHHQRPESTGREKSRGGLQPVPEEAAADWTSATWPGDVMGRRVDDVLRHRRDVTGAARSVDTRSGPIGQLESRATSDAISPEVPEADYRIWFPRADTKPPEEWRTFSEYRYTECSRGDVLEKTLSVEQVFEKDRKNAQSDHQESSLETVRCLTTPDGNVQVSRDQALSRTREKSYKEHSSQLTRFDIFPEVLQKSSPVTKAVVESADESKVSCQRFCKGFSYSGRDFEGDMLTLKPPLLESEDDEFEVLAPTEPPLGFQDGSFVSEDDEFDVRKSTYIKIDSVDAIVQDCAMEGVIIRDVASDDLGDIVEEAEEEVEQLETGEFSSSQREKWKEEERVRWLR
ncbi:hypothetical protein ISCGN_006748 [Ixodes scapularis]